MNLIRIILKIQEYDDLVIYNNMNFAKGLN
jgi:hypothetical protein